MKNNLKRIRNKFKKHLNEEICFELSERDGDHHNYGLTTWENLLNKKGNVIRLSIWLQLEQNADSVFDPNDHSMIDMTFKKLLKFCSKSKLISISITEQEIVEKKSIKVNF